MAHIIINPSLSAAIGYKFVLNSAKFAVVIAILEPANSTRTDNSYVLNAYLYCVYALVGGAISIRDLYICAVSRVCAKACCLPQARCLCSENVASFYL